MKEIKGWALMREDGTIAQNRSNHTYAIFSNAEMAYEMLKKETKPFSIQKVTIIVDDITPVDN